MDEKKFFLKTMLRNYRRSYECRFIKDDYYYNFYHEMFRILCIHADSHTILDEDKRIKAFSLFSKNLPEGTLLHFVYVGKKYRGTGLALKLIQSLSNINTLKISLINKPFVEKFGKNNLEYMPFSRFLKLD